MPAPWVRGFVCAIIALGILGSSTAMGNPDDGDPITLQASTPTTLSCRVQSVRFADGVLWTELAAPADGSTRL